MHFNLFRRRMCNGSPAEKGFDTVETHISWVHHPDGYVINFLSFYSNQLRSLEDLSVQERTSFYSMLRFYCLLLFVMTSYQNRMLCKYFVILEIFFKLKLSTTTAMNTFIYNRLYKIGF